MDQRYGPICNPVRRALSGVSELTIEGQFADASTTITGASYTKLLTFPRYVLPNATASHLDSTIRVVLTVGQPLPVCLQLRTFPAHVGMSQRCQQRTRAPQTRSRSTSRE